MIDNNFLFGFGHVKGYGAVGFRSVEADADNLNVVAAYFCVVRGSCFNRDVVLFLVSGL